MTSEEKQVSKAFRIYWKAHFNRGKGAFEKVLSLWHPDITAIGTGKDEIVKTRNEFRIFLKREFKEVKTTMPVKILWSNVQLQKDQALVLGETEVTISKENKIKIRIRVSSVFKKPKNKWLMYHIHGSIPASAQRDNESFPIDGLIAEKEKLEKEVAEKTAALQNKNRVLEIETALERVRAIAMAMRKPEDMLKVCKTIALQLQKLGVKEIRNVQTAIFYPQRGNYMNYEYYAKHNKTLITETTYTNNKLHKEFALKMIKGKGEIFVTHIKGKKIKEWIAYQKTTNVFIDNYLKTASSLNYYWFSLGPVALGISTYLPLTDEETNLFKRFLKVFELAYLRYLDIEKALAQAKEAKIEASLERVRAVAMGMLKSDELLKVCEVVFKELRTLGFNDIDLRNTQIVINNDDKGMYYGYQYSDYIGGEIAEVPYNMHPVIKMLNDKLRQSSDAFVDIEISGSALKEWKVFVKSFPQKPDKKLLNAKELHYYFYSVGIGALGISSFQSLTEDKLKILQRLRNVFNLAYKRYTDIALAEAQAREAQIETSLERMRATAMSMQKPEDLLNISRVFFKELVALGISNIRCALIHIFNDEKGYYYDYDYSDFTGGKITHIPYTGHKSMEAFLKKIRRSEDAFVEFISKGTDLKTWIQFRKESGQIMDERINNVKQLNYYFYSIGEGNIGVSTFGKIEAEQIEILKRFRNVFKLSYQRYVDIEKAEAQAREAQIEAALERVRSRSLAMHKSDELQEVVNTVFERLKALEIDMNVASIFLFKEGSKDWEQWVASSDTNYSTYFRIPYTDNIIFRDLEDAKQSGKDFYSVRYSLEEKNRWFSYAFKKTEYSRIPAKRKKFLLKSNFYQVSFALSKHIGLQVAKYSVYDFSEKDNEILKRFCRVFEQAYVRFLDLQIAEAQAREAQIQASLERVRASAMAMHKSEQLLDVCEMMFKEFLSLGFDEIRNAIINIHYDSDNSFINYDYAEVAGKSVNRFTNDVLPFVSKIMKISHSASDAFSETHISGKTLTKFRDLRKQTGQKDEPRLNKAKSLYFYFYSIGIGAIGISTYGPINTEKIALLKRFRDVFDLSYKRYIDISKAEEQAREAEIELALERVRARTMAMQHSNELADTARVLYEQFNELGEDPDQLTIGTVNETEKVLELWLSVKGQKIGEMFKVPIDEPTVIKKIYTAWRKGKKSVVVDISGNELKKYNDFRNSLPGYKSYNDIKNSVSRKEHRRVMQCAFFSRGLLVLATPEPRPEEAIKILERFAKVFEQTYTRFLDLKKAEKQAREAQIEAALEKVRSRTMAMQKSDELLEVASIVFQQVKALGIPQWDCGINIWNNGDKEFTFYPGTRDGKILPSPCKIPLMEHPVFRRFHESRMRGDDLFIYEKEGDEQADHYRYMLSVPVLGDNLRSHEEAGFQFPSYQIDHLANFAYGNLIFITYKHFPEMHDVFIRFAKVFEQTYTRFLDLQKAEAQAREAQIEAALERVRSRSMAMHKSDELLNVIAVVSEQLQLLGFNFDNVSFAENNQVHDYKFWLSVANKSGAYYIYVPYLDNPMFERAKEAQQKGLSFYSDVLTPEENMHWHKHVFDHNDMDFVTEERKEYIFKKGFARSVAFLPNIMLIIGNYASKPYSEEENKIISRFAAVFQQSYTRFLDLQKAEAQAREAEIELGLERVRARAMAMNKSNELAELVSKLFTELNKLDFALTRCYIYIIDPVSLSLRSWTANTESGEISESYFIKYLDLPYYKTMIKDWKENKQKLIYQLGGEEKQIVDRVLLEETEYSRLPENVKKGMKSADQVFLAFSFNKYGALQTGGLEPLSEANLDILIRFGKVFEQTYTRFLDLQKAEAQARESQIEAALERVRAKAMAMHSSDDLALTVDSFFSELTKLGIVPHRCGVGILDPETRVTDIRATTYTKEKVSKKITGKLKLAGHPILDKIFETWKQQKEYHPVLRGKEILDYYKVMNPQVEFPDFANDEIQYGHYFNFKEGGVFAWTNKELSENDIQIFRRFTSVLSLTYRRYLDLKEAEAQAREAQIEAALERVRSRSMGMQKSEELKDVIKEVYDQFIQLNIHVDHAGFVVDYAPKADWHFWIADKNEIPSKITHPYFESVWASQFDEAKEKGIDSFATNLNFEEKNKFYNELLSYVPGLPEESKQFYLSCPALSATTVLQENVSLYIENFSGTLYSDDENDILKRFGKVFQQTYTRFLDLQKAEAQAREAEIQLALERVRARAMAMQKSTELAELVATLFNQLNHLDFALTRCYIYIIDPESLSLNAWTANTESGGLPECYFIKYLEVPYYKAMINAWRKREQEFVYELGGNEKIETDRILFSETEYKRLPENVKSGMISVDRVFLSFSFNNYGALQTGGLEPLSKENLEILSRFGKIFDQNYTRFLDLQKAEAQAREAQIEAALERVRAKAMAMHSSKDLAETIEVFYRELKSLGVIPRRCGVALVEKETRLAEVSTMNTTEEGDSVEVIGKIKMIGHPVLEKIFDHWLLQKEYHTVLRGNQIKDYYQVLKPQISYPDYPHDAVQFGYYFMFKEGDVYAWTDKELIEEELKIFRRFTTVISLTYKRYKDLQQAEAQAREAQIEAALEKVRSRTIGMQHSDELIETSYVVLQQLQSLGLSSQNSSFAFGIFDEEKGNLEVWQTLQENKKVPHRLTFSFTELSTLKNEFDTWKKTPPKERKNLLFVHDFSGNLLEEYISFFESQEDFKEGVQYLRISGAKRIVHHDACFSHGNISFTRVDSTSLNEGELEILQRFAQVFEQTYTRFLDLEKAEAQNKIIQAENDRKTKELEDARKLQLSMLPKELPKLPHLDISVYMKTATEVGGDYYDFNVDDNGSLTFIVGDATGHGMMSGMMVSIMKSFFISNQKKIELKEFFESTGDSIKDMHLGRLMMPLIGVQITSEKLIATNAGMPSLVYFRQKSQKAGEFVSNNMPLGAMKGIKYSLKEIRYEKGDTLLLMSDGFAELKNENGEQYGYERVKEDFRSVAQKSPNEVINHLKTSASNWTKEVEPDDDVTFVVIKVK